MRAAIISRFGPPDVLEIRHVPDPTPAPHEVVVRVAASAINRADVLQRIGKYPPPPGAPRDIPGIEFAGEVAACGAHATRWRQGDRVFGLIGGGAHADYVAVHQDTLASVPNRLTWHEAAAIPEVFITAYDAMVTQGKLGAGDQVLIHAVGSGVGLAAVQVARAWQATAYGTSRTAAKLDEARTYGMHDGVVIDGDFAPLAAAVERWTGGRGVDLVVDLVGGPYVQANIDVAAPRARLLLIGAIAGSSATIDVRRVLGKRLTLQGTVLRSRGHDEKVRVTEAFAREVVPRVAAGELRATVGAVFPLDRIAEAHALMESNDGSGKIVLDVTAGG